MEPIESIQLEKKSYFAPVEVSFNEMVRTFWYVFFFVNIIHILSLFGSSGLRVFSNHFINYLLEFGLLIAVGIPLVITIVIHKSAKIGGGIASVLIALGIIMVIFSGNLSYLSFSSIPEFIILFLLFFLYCSLYIWLGIGLTILLRSYFRFTDKTRNVIKRFVILTSVVIFSVIFIVVFSVMYVIK